MEFLYLMLITNEWEDMVILSTQEDAIQTSKKYPNNRIEIFSKNINVPGYSPTYDYYKNGKIYTVEDFKPHSG